VKAVLRAMAARRKVFETTIFFSTIKEKSRATSRGLLVNLHQREVSTAGETEEANPFLL
jgi:hypothetical protein